MSNDNLKKDSTPVKLERLHLSSRIKVEITPEFADKVRFLCKKSPKDEWSGVLFYEVKGSIRKASEMVIIPKHILLMDIGNATYTSFDWDEDVINYRMDNPETLDMVVGHIHSHNTMNVFFSGTDISELNDNSPLHNFYFSLIINNFMEMEAKVAFTSASQKFVCKDEEGKDYTLTVKNAPIMFTYDCDIEIPGKEIDVDEAFANRFKEVEEKIAKKKEEAKKTTTSTTYPSNKVVQGDFFKGEMKSSFPDWEGSKSYKGGDRASINYLNSQLAKEFGEEEEDDDTDFTKQTVEQEFACFVLRLGNINEEDDELVDALEDIEQSQINAVSLAASISHSYGAYYANFFEKLTRYADDKAFLDVTEELVNIYEEFEKSYPFLEPIIEALKEIGTKFENFKKDQAVTYGHNY